MPPFTTTCEPPSNCPQVREAARLRAALALDPSMERLLRTVLKGDDPLRQFDRPRQMVYDRCQLTAARPRVRVFPCRVHIYAPGFIFNYQLNLTKPAGITQRKPDRRMS
jgi:hypothetical protein